MESTGRDREAALDRIAFVLSESALGFTETIEDVASRAVSSRPYPRLLWRFAWLAVTVRGAVEMGRAAGDRGKAFLEVAPLYAEATGFDQAQSRTDMLFIQDRLVMCASGSPPDTVLVQQVARRLVHWVPDGRLADPELAATEACYTALIDFNKGGAQAWKSSHSAVLQEAYRAAWRGALEAPG